MCRHNSDGAFSGTKILLAGCLTVGMVDGFVALTVVVGCGRCGGWLLCFKCSPMQQGQTHSLCVFFAFLNFFIIITQNTHHQRQPTMRRAAIIIAFSHVFLKFLKKVCHTFSKTIIKSSLFTS
jgi:hypothetical protein